MSLPNLLTLKENTPMTTLSLDKQTYPLMMHLGILPKYGDALQPVNYNPSSQTSEFNNSMKSSWSTNSSSTWKVLTANDSDSQEDD
jgi:hypothetical protein